jgi:hypothetical protein
MTTNHEQVFLEFVKGHDELQHLSYSKTKIKNQKIIGLSEETENDTIFKPFIKTLITETDILVDPNYDEIYNNFIHLDHNLDSIEYIKNLFDVAETKEKTLELILSLIIKPLIESNINTKKVYFRVKPYWNTEWCDEVIEVQ